MRSTPMRNRNRRSDVGGSPSSKTTRATGDMSSGVGGRRNAGPAATQKRVAKKPRGKWIMYPGGQAGYHDRNRRPGA
jgi:hypothetical protein